jgi:hypothetical protein
MLCIRWYANYNVTTWCEMQTVIWMPYSESTHFSYKNSYRTLWISSYHSKDMSFARYKHFLPFSVKQRGDERFSPRQSEPERLTAGPECWLDGWFGAGDWDVAAECWPVEPSCQRKKRAKRCEAMPQIWFKLGISGSDTREQTTVLLQQIWK